MALRIVSADERLAEQRGIKACIFGKSGMGKTSLLWTLPPQTTLFADLEAGDLAVNDWPGATVRLRTWPECRDFAVFIGGPNPALRDDQAYSPAHYEAVAAEFGAGVSFDAFETIFVDSITVAGRLCFQWCRGQPEAFSEKTGKPDIRGAYGLHGREMIGWLTHSNMHAHATSSLSAFWMKSSTILIAAFSARKLMAAKPASSCPASSIRSSPWPRSKDRTARNRAPSSVKR